MEKILDFKNKTVWIIIVVMVLIGIILNNSNKVECITCGGNGKFFSGYSYKECDVCHGSGRVSKSINSRIFGIESLK